MGQRARVFQAWTGELPQWRGPLGKTRYTAQALHWTVADGEKHQQMGFHKGWGESLDDLVSLVTTT